MTRAFVLSQLQARWIVLAGSLLATLAAAGSLAWGPLGARAFRALPGLANVSPDWLWLAAAAFAASLVASAGAWRACLRPLGYGGDLRDACARFGAGSLANSLLPARLGDAARIALFSRRIGGDAPLWQSGGGLVGVEVVRAAVLTALFAAAALTGALPLWPVFALPGVALGGVALGVLRRKHLAPRRFGQLADALVRLLQSPTQFARVAGWIAAATVLRLLAIAAILASLGVSSPLATAVPALAALELVGVFPVTPGNLGVAGGAVALALRTRGVDLGHALTLGIAFNAVETLVGICFGILGLLRLSNDSQATSYRPLMRIAGGAAVALALLGCAAVTGVRGDFA